MQKARRRPIIHPLAINSLRHCLRVCRRGGGIDPGYRIHAASLLALPMLLAPLRAVERLWFGRRVRATDIAHPPLFIVGHWRTGTTHLHNLLAQDPGLAFVSTFQTLSPASFLTGLSTLRPLIARHVPDTRHMDNMPLSVDSPQEEEFALCNLTPYSFYVGWYFPRQMRELFHNYVLFDGASSQAREEWAEVYLGVLKKATLRARGKRLVLKNPVNTGRIRALLDLFPDAKFIHIYRSPYRVFKSTQRLHRTTFDMVGLQDIADGEIERNVLDFYRALMTRFFEDKALIPEGNLVELRFEDLEHRPMEELARLYDELALPGWAAAYPRIRAYLDAQPPYK
ncbi:MAG: sulfotransferase, partial [Candidatus Hydrogenedentes bacterium]|nr:sulfotransferase [Candidatus Hydrogenedentota bacterium]